MKKIVFYIAVCAVLATSSAARTSDKFADEYEGTGMQGHYQAGVVYDGEKDISSKKAEERKILVEKQQTKAQRKMAEGQAQWKNGALDKAVSTLEKAAGIDPSNRRIAKILKAMQGQKKKMDETLTKASKLIKEKRFDQAERILRKAGRINSEYLPYVTMLKKLNFTRKKVKEERIAAYKQKTKAKRKLLEGQAQWRRGALDKAVLALNEAAGIDPSSQQIAKVLKGMQGQKKMMDDDLIQTGKLIGKERFDQAEKILKKAAYISRQYPAYNDMLKKLDSAKNEAEKKKKDERFANELLKKAKDFWNKGQLADAADILSIGSKEFPQNKDINRSLQNVQQAQADSVKLTLPETIPFLALFRLNAIADPNAAFGKYADTSTAEKLQNLGAVLSPISDPSRGWQLFFETSVVAMASLSEQIVLTMFYNPWADIALLCEWTRLGVSPKITQIRLICGDKIRNSEIPVLLPLWRRTVNVPPPLSAIVANSDTMQAFLNLYGRHPSWPASQWPAKLPVLKTDNPDKDNEKMVGLFFSQNLSGISEFFNNPTNSKLRTSMERILKQLISGQTEKVLLNAPETLKETRDVLTQLNRKYWQNAKVVSVASDRRNIFLFLSVRSKPNLFVSFWFDAHNTNDAKLRRIDFFRYDLDFKTVDKLAQEAGMMRPIHIDSGQEKQTIYPKNGGEL